MRQCRTCRRVVPRSPHEPGRRPLARALALALSLAATIAGGIGAQETVKIYRDELGLGHVYADTDEAVAYGIGRLHFRDRPVRTMVNLTRGRGALLATVGQLNPLLPLTDDANYSFDVRAIRFHYPQHAQYLYNRYASPNATAEEKKLKRLLDAFTKGVNDERNARAASLSSYLVQNIADYEWTMSYTQAQFDALFARNVDPWEPLAVIHMATYEIWAPRIENFGRASPIASTAGLMPSGSNSWAIPSGGSDTGHTFIYSDSHQPPDWYVACRFKARNGTLDGGGFGLSGFPFLLMGFGKNVCWGLTLSNSNAAIDFDIFDGDLTTTPGTWIDDAGVTRSIHETTSTLAYRTTPGQALQTVAITERYLDAAGDRWISATESGAESPHRIYSSHYAFGNPAPPTANDPGSDPTKLFYRLLTATDADDALANAVGGTLSAINLNLTMGDNVRAITTPMERAPYRKHTKAFTAFWTAYSQPRQRSFQDDGWIVKNGRVLYPVSEFPVVRSDGTTPVRNGKPLLFWANCNNSPAWLLGLEYPFGHPLGGAPYDVGNPDYISPFDLPSYLDTPSDLLNRRHWGAPWGQHTLRQEWITTGLKASWAATKPAGISETLQRIMMTDNHAPIPVYLETVGFFDELIQEVPAGALRTLATRMKNWAKRLAPHAHAPLADAEDAARFVVFWAFFRREMTGPWERGWSRPFEWSFFKPSDHDDVKTGALKALALTHQKFVQYPNLDFAALKRYRIPFGGPDVPVLGTRDSGHSTGRAWAVAPWTSGQPRINGAGGGRMPMLMRLRKPGEAHHAVTTMTPALSGRVNTLPEWTATNGPNFHEAPIRWASAQLYDLPMTEAALGALAYDAQVTRTFTYQPSP